MTDEITVNTYKNDQPVNIEDIMHTAYLQYSLSVNVGRAIPDVRDGLKTGNRRILYAMKQIGVTKSHAYTKCAKVVGEVIGNYHPHGDQSVYDTLVRMAQDFAMRSPLIDGQGNFGSIDGDPPAAYRYTECRMERLSEELLADIEKDTVDMMPTFDETTTEPEVLPARFPNLLVNGTTGIGVGMATNIPPHNLGEVIDAVIALLDEPSLSILELMGYIKGPDFPTAATIRGIGEIHRLYHTGRGVIKLRSKAEIHEVDGKEQIIITEIPYAVNKENLVKKIADLVKEKKITGISALRDETSRRVGIRIVVDIKKNAMGNVVLNQLFAHTSLETGIACCLLVIDKNKPRIMNLKQVLQAYIDHRENVVTRRTRFELNKAEARAHILEGLLEAVKNIDEVVKIIRESRDRKLAAQALIDRFSLTKVQSNAILDMRLHQLTGLAIEDLEKEYYELLKHIEYLKSILGSRELRIDIIKKELLEIKNKYADARKTDIEITDEDFSIADLIERHACVITVSKTGYIQRVPTETFKTQHRGGKGVRGMETREEDYIEHLFVADSHDLVFFFTEKGTMYWLNVYDIPEGTRTGKGKAVINLIKVENNERIRGMLTLSKEALENENLYITMATKNGYIKKTQLPAFKNLRNAGIRAITIEDGDTLVGTAITDGRKEILLSTAMGMACHFKEEEVRPMGRTARGVTGIRFKLKNDYVIGMLAVEPSTPDEIVEEDETEPAETEVIDTHQQPQMLVITDKGMGKRSYVNKYRLTKRGAKGVVSIKMQDDEYVVGTVLVEKGAEIILSTRQGNTVRTSTDEIRTVGRASRGVRIMRFTDPGSKISSIAKLINVDLDDNREDSVSVNNSSKASESNEENSDQK
ncbi:MAG: DNA gyrase subunit A [Victivallales bacterium]|nr:DNA gyrase subunit A [Victivallales bacterium]MCF7888598.1 DNA gyrase subunit A [Victivallales bacterium]